MKLSTLAILIGATANLSAQSDQGVMASPVAPEAVTPSANWQGFGSGYLTFYLDNDLFASTDRDYTNGARISWISGNRSLQQIGRVQSMLLPFAGDDESMQAFKAISGFHDPQAVRYNYGYSLTQLMFTPEDKYATTQPIDQRRYAGWLALGFSLHTKDDQTLNSVEFLAGATGRLSLAHESQDVIHDLIQTDRFEGWNKQIPTVATADLSFVQKRRLDFGDQDGKLRIDGIGEWGGRLGTFRSGAHVGSMIRIGLFLPADFTDPRLSETSYAHKYFTSDVEMQSAWSLFGFAGVTGSFVGFDASLDGPLFHNFETGNHRKPWVGEYYSGIGFRYKSWEISYAQIFRSREYEEQNQANTYGSVSIRREF